MTGQETVLPGGDSTGTLPLSSNGPDAGEPAGLVHLERTGPALIGYRSRTTQIELEATEFESYRAEEGLESIIKTRAERGDSANPGKEIYSRCAKSPIEVGGAGATVTLPARPPNHNPASVRVESRLQPSRACSSGG